MSSNQYPYTLHVNFSSVECLPVVLLCRVCKLLKCVEIKEYPKLCVRDSSVPQLTVNEGDRHHHSITINGAISIARYLCRIEGNSNELLKAFYPFDDVHCCGEIDSVLEEQQSLFMHLRLLAYTTTMNATHHGDVTAYHYRLMVALLSSLQERVGMSSDFPWLVGDRCTLADLIISCNLLTLNWSKCVDFSEFQPLVKWMDTVVNGEVLGARFVACCADFGWCTVHESILYARPRMLRLLADPQANSKQTRKTSILSQVNFKYVSIMATDALVDEVDGRYDGDVIEYDGGIRIHRKNLSQFDNSTSRYHQVGTMVLPGAALPMLKDTLKDMKQLFPKLEAESLSTLRVLHDLSPTMKTVYMAMDLKVETGAMTRGARFDYVLLHEWRELPDGFVMMMTSLEDFQSKKGYVRPELCNSGFVVRPRPDGTLWVHLNFDLRFPARVPNWIDSLILNRTYDYMHQLATVVCNK